MVSKADAIQAISGLADDFFATQTFPPQDGSRFREYNVLDTEDVGALNKLLNRFVREGWTLDGKIKDYNKIINSGATSHRFWCTLSRPVKLV